MAGASWRLYAFTIAEAERQDNHKALKELRDIGAPPHAAKKMMVQRKMAPALRRHRTRNVLVEVLANHSRRAGSVDL